MKIRNKTVLVYDIEVFQNIFHCAVKNTETNEIHLFEISSWLVYVSSFLLPKLALLKKSAFISSALVKGIFPWSNPLIIGL